MPDRISESHTGKERYQAVRASFVAQNTSLNAWCRENGVAIQNARAAIRGDWRGPKATILVNRICAAAGVKGAA